MAGLHDALLDRFRDRGDIRDLAVEHVFLVLPERRRSYDPELVAFDLAHKDLDLEGSDIKCQKVVVVEDIGDPEGHCFESWDKIGTEDAEACLGVLKGPIPAR